MNSMGKYDGGLIQDRRETLKKNLMKKAKQKHTLNSMESSRSSSFRINNQQIEGENHSSKSSYIEDNSNSQSFNSKGILLVGSNPVCYSNDTDVHNLYNAIKYSMTNLPNPESLASVRVESFEGELDMNKLSTNAKLLEKIDEASGSDSN